ncbi:C-type lectin domain family 2 member L-like isoform X2 [Lissotriton helveticus]
MCNIFNHEWFDMRPFVFPCLIAACILSFLLALVVIILAALLQQKKCSSNGAAMRLEPCPLDWLYNGRTCYYFSKEREDWNQSQLFCSFHNSSLALINSQSELNFLVELTCEHHNWIGLRRRGDTFEWANGTACNSTLCSITDFGECAYIEDAAVRVSGCSLTRPYICTRKPFVGT